MEACTGANGFSALQREIQEMPVCVRQALDEHELMKAYRGRPAYQRNDHLAWIKRAKRPARTTQ